MGDFPTSHGSGKHYRVAPAEGKWRLTIVLPWWCHEYHWETLSYMAFPRHAEVGTASAILDSLGWDGLGRRRHSFPGDGNWNHAAPLDLQNISAEFNSSVVVHQHNFRDTWPNLWYNAIYRIGHFTPVAAEKSPVLTAQKIPATARPLRCSMRPGRGAAIPLIPWSQGTVAMGTTRKWPTKNSILSIDLGK